MPDYPPQVCRFHITPGKSVNLGDYPTDAREYDRDRKDAEEQTEKNLEKLQALQELLYADGGHAVLVVLQAMDAGGKDSTIRHVFGHLNPQGCRVTSFKVPTELERSHDFLWRHHLAMPAKGMIHLHNRSHYESVLVERVKQLVSKSVWQARYDQINHFEAMLAAEGMTIVKIFLHLSKEEQRERLLDRQQRPDKHWKFNPSDLEERKRWDEYQDAFRDALVKTSTDHAPWFAVPADQKWYRNLIVSELMLSTLEGLKLAYPPAPPNIADYVIER